MTGRKRPAYRAEIKFDPDVQDLLREVAGELRETRATLTAASEQLAHVTKLVQDAIQRGLSLH